MRINNLKINGYGNVQGKEISLEDNLNIIHGKNESGKSTILNFISNSLYGISKNKNGKEISDFEKYMPWSGSDFSGKIEYELNDGEKFEVFRDFKKKNPTIYNENKEDISKEFNIDKSRGNEFFYEQTKVDEELFLSTIVVNQQEVKLGKQEQSILIQKLANLVGTGDDNISYKRAIDRINRRQLDEIGTSRSREKPINMLERNISNLQKEKIELEEYEMSKYKIEENKSNINTEIGKLENEKNYLKELKLVKENQKIEEEKIKIKENIKKDNLEKINLLKNEIQKIKKDNQNLIENEKEKIKNKIEKENLKIKKLNRKILLFFIILLIINIIQFFIIKNNFVKYIFLLTIPLFLFFYIILKNKYKKKEERNRIEENGINKEIEKVKEEVKTINNEINLIEKNNAELDNEIGELKNNFILKIKLEKEKIKNKYFNKIEKNRIDEINSLENINYEIINIENKLNDKKIELHKIELDTKNIEPKLDNLAKIEEDLVEKNNNMLTLKRLETSMELAKNVLAEAYEKMKNTVTPKFTQNLSENISRITGGKYTNIMFNDEQGLIIELENGNYVTANALSIGTIDQLYLSLRLSMVKELSEETMPIILDEAFAYCDTERLNNILNYIAKKFAEHQIIIFTCTDREKEILDKNNIKYNYIEI